jgi:hypothetical protein
MVMLTSLLALALGGSPSASLSITVWPKSRTHAATHWTLRCDPPGGTLPARSTACRRLSSTPDDPFAPVPREAVCTLIYGGPQEALVTGTFRGRRVWTRFTRQNGCQIQRWNRVAYLFPA